MIARQTPTARRPRRRLPAAIASLLALVGVVLIVAAACSSQPAPPAPSAAAAGTIDGETRSSAPMATPDTTTSATLPPTSAASAPDATPGTTAEDPATTTAVPPVTAPAPAPLILPAATPVSLNIPVIGAQSSLVGLGLNSDGTIATPPIDEKDSKAGWYDRSPQPGTLGPAILLGHIDSKSYGPAIFYNLGKLVPGDTVEVTRSDNTVAVFQVDGVREYQKAQFPTLQVYGNLDHAGLRLITCGGAFNNDTGHYESNIVVFASLVSSRAA
ncbi:MAG: class F sortase [Nakamurella sp.]